MTHVNTYSTLSQEISARLSIAAIVVTHNRLQLLKECIAALEAQYRKPDEIIVIDNGSEDGTSEWLLQQTSVTHLRQANMGSSGGQHAGMDLAWRKGHDWFWCMDDDTIPQPGALAALIGAPAISLQETGLLASVVRWTDGTIHAMNAPQLARATTLPNRFRFDHVQAAKQLGSLLQIVKDRCVEISAATFVSTLVSRHAVEEAGLPLKDMFIWGDDTEFTTRVNRRFKMYCVLTSEVVHKTFSNEGPPRRNIRPDQSLKYCYGVRNTLVGFRSEGASWPITSFKITAFFSILVLRAMKAQIPWVTLRWAVRGLFFPIQPDKPGA